MRYQMVIGAMIYLVLALVLAAIIQTGTRGEPGTVPERWNYPYCRGDAKVYAGARWLSISLWCSW